MVGRTSEAPNSKSDPSIQLYDDLNTPHRTVLIDRDSDVGSNRHGRSVEKGGPDVHGVGVLISGRDAGWEGDLLIMISGVACQAVVVDSDLVVGVLGLNRDLEDRRQGGPRDIEAVYGGVLEEEPGLGWLQHGPNDQDR
uniref:Uncharacterized protein n=1 Tax=Opuntia streptacantha TaxID=393608 RepID=A0A7C8Z3S2_OPUST